MIVNSKYYESNLNLICELFFRAFRIRLGKSFFRWRYLNNPFNKTLASFKFYGDQLVGNYSASPCVLSINKIKYSAALSMTTMTDPSYFGMGIFTDLAKELYQYLEDAGYKYIFGFPNKNSHLTFVKKLGWIDICTISTMQLNINDIDTNNLFIGETYIQDDSRFELDYSSTQDYQKYIFVKKDQMYLKWRYRDAPNHDYKNFVIQNNNKVSSYCIIKYYKKNNAIDLIDMQPKNIIETNILIKYIIIYAIQNQIGIIFTWIPDYFFTRHVYETIGFTDTKSVTCFAGKKFDTGNEEISLEKLPKWYIQMGDSDVY